MNNQRKNVLMTTLSTLHNKNTINYYYHKASAKKICSGISSLEAGSKYFLSTVPIDKIVVIGSPETIDDSDEAVSADLLTLPLTSPEQFTKHSAFEFYKQRIASFLQGYDIDEIFARHLLQEKSYQIEDSRAEVLCNIVLNELSSLCAGKKISEYLSNALNTQENPNTFFLELENQIKLQLFQDIDNSFLHDFSEKYIDNNKLRQLKETYSGIANIDVKQYSDEQRKKIEQDATLTPMERQYLFTFLKMNINQVLSEQEHYHTLIKSEETIHGLYQEIHILDKQLEQVKEKRKLIESDYIRHLIYKQFDSSDKFSPLDENRISKTLPIYFINESTADNKDNLTDIVNTLCGVNEQVNLYIDMQGGKRTSGYVRNAVLSILTNQPGNRVAIAEIIATNYDHNLWVNEIIEETKRYKILDLATGMNAFIRYGKADLLQSYCEAVAIPASSPFRLLVDCMVRVDNALSLCDIGELASAIEELRSFFKTANQLEADDFSNIYQVLLNGIRQDYDTLLTSSSMQYIDLIEWSVKKGFLQQALTLIEDKMPSVYFHNQWLSCDINAQQDHFLRSIGNSYDHRTANIIFYRLASALVPKDWKERTNQNLNLCNELWWYYKTNGKNTYKPIFNLNFFASKLKETEYGSDYSYIFTTEVEELLKDTRQKLISLPANQQKKCFPFLYSKFRSIEHYYENPEEKRRKATPQRLTSYSPEVFYFFMEKNNYFSYKKPSINFTVLSCLGSHTYQYGKSSDKNHFPISLELQLHTNLQPAIKQLEEFFLLHNALKLERNCNNHASEKGVRLPKSVVETALLLYIQQFRQLQQLIDSE